MQSSLMHEIYNNLLIEGYISSRKMVKDVVNRKNDKNADIIIKIFLTQWFTFHKIEK